jgi:hypothetical protein
LRTEKTKVRDVEDDFIYLITHRAAYKVDITFTLSDGSTETKSETYTIAAGDRKKIQQIPWGWNNYLKTLISAETWKDDVAQYSIKLSYDTGYFSWAELYTMTYVLSTFTGDYYKMVFKNTLGVYECINLYGKRDDDNEYDRGMSYIDELDIVYSSNQKKSFTINTGWITQDEYNNLLLLLNSKDTYIIEDGLTVPVFIKSKKSPRRSSDNYLYSMDIEFSYAFTDNF